jgi:phenylacetic acid degradation operon negative regulatory protein
MRVAATESRSMNARSLALSLLLGTRPPRLPVSSLVAAGELFGVSSGAMRTALSRMVASGDVHAEDGSYSLAGRLIERQEVQDVGRAPVTSDWDGRWVTVTPRNASRSLADRRELRRRLEALRLGELRPDYWLRPANIDLAALESVGTTSNLIVVVGTMAEPDQRALVEQLWPLAGIRSQAVELADELAGLSGSLPRHPDDGHASGQDAGPLSRWLVKAFLAAADVVRFLTHEPRLPAELVGLNWEPDRLRTDYDRFEQLFQREMATFFRSASGHSR